MKKNQYFLIIFLLLIFCFISSDFALALEIKDYPNIPGVPKPTENCKPTECLPIYIVYFFGLGVYLAGVLAVISLAIGGIQLIISGENPENIGNAKDRIKGAILGLVLTVSAFIILRTINPVLITPTLSPLEGVAGVFYVKGKEERPVSYFEPNTSSTTRDGFTKIKYKCVSDKSPVLLVWKYPKTNFEDYQNAFVERVNCGGETSVALSFKMAFETPGVYYFLKENCQGFMSDAKLSDEQLDNIFKKNVKSIKIVNDAASNTYFGFVAHESPNFRGKCDIPRVVRQDPCSPVDIPFSSINIFKWNRLDWKTSGDGLVFYNKPYGYKTGANAGFYKLSSDDLDNFWNKNSEELSFDYRNINAPQEEKNSCKNFKQCSGSIKVQGNYLVALYSQSQGAQGLVGEYCQVFYKDVPNLKGEEVLAEGKQASWIYAFPIK